MKRIFIKQTETVRMYELTKSEKYDKNYKCQKLCSIL